MTLVFIIFICCVALWAVCMMVGARRPDSWHPDRVKYPVR